MEVLVEQFSGITGRNRRNAMYYLETNRNNLDRALNAYFENPDAVPDNYEPSVPPPNNNNSNNINLITRELPITSENKLIDNKTQDISISSLPKQKSLIQSLFYDFEKFELKNNQENPKLEFINPILHQIHLEYNPKEAKIVDLQMNLPKKQNISKIFTLWENGYSIDDKFFNLNKQKYDEFVENLKNNKLNLEIDSNIIYIFNNKNKISFINK